MPLWDQLKNRTQTLAEQLNTKKDQYRSREFADASMAMCALVAAADGSVDAAERQKTASLIASNDVLAVFPRTSCARSSTTTATSSTAISISARSRRSRRSRN
ncbi:MAG TPA: tellurite resistance TerB family protein [Jatrophihabitans sp.]|nr:tellurite resistance TerB family protein [Jatrophihabitans sp.]